jgi:hypothetical protein
MDESPPGSADDGTVPKLPKVPRSTTFRRLVAMLVTALLAGFALGGCGGHGRHATRQTARTTRTPDTSSGPPRCAADSDRTAAVNTMIADTPNGSTVRFPSGACLRVDGTISIVGRHDLTIDGNGTTFVRASATPNTFSAQWLIQASTGVTIVSVHVEGPKHDGDGFNHTYEGQPGMAIDNSVRVTVENSTIRGVWGDFFRISNLTDTVRIANNVLTQAGRQGLAVVGGANIVFDHNVVSNARRFAIDLEPYGSSPVHAVTISNNQLLHPTYGFICATGFDRRCVRRGLSDVSVTGNVEQW